MFKNDKIENFLVTEGKKEDISTMTKKVIDALAMYAEKVSIKKAYYVAPEKKWYPLEFSPSKYFGEVETANELLSIVKEMKMLEMSQDSISIEEFNKNVILLKNKILGGIEKDSEKRKKKEKRNGKVDNENNIWKQVEKTINKKEEDEKVEDKIICNSCGNDTFRVYCTVIIDDARLYCTKCGKDPEE